MGYQLNRLATSVWSVVDEDGRLKFEGSLNACEAWLDQQESATQKTWFESISGFFKRSATDKRPLVKELSTTDSHSSFRITT
jgi:hypothetical protein